MAKFKSKKKIKIKKRYFLYIIILFLLYILFSYISTKFNLNSNDKFIIRILSNTNYHLVSPSNESIFSNLISKMIDVNDPVGVLKNQRQNKIILKDDLKLSFNNMSKTIYLYNTHDLEEYNNKVLEKFNINSDVKMASSLLSNELKKMGFNVIVESRKVSELVKKENSQYLDNYQVTKLYLEEIKKSNNVSLYIDLHRDDLKKELTTITIDNKEYAKIKFIVGMSHKNSDLNYELASCLNEKIQNKYSGLTSGIVVRENYTYNQQIDENMLFINIGGYENTIDEVYNTIGVLAPLIREVLDEKDSSSK